jgi:hypothetical protein
VECLPLREGFLVVVAVNCCVYSRNRCKFLTILTLLIKGPVHGEKCVKMFIVKSYLIVFLDLIFMYFVCCIFFKIATIFEIS